MTTSLRERQRAAVRRALAPEAEAFALYRPKFPTTEMVAAAAALYDPLPRWTGHEGPRPRLTVSPGVVGVSRRDLARRERTDERAGRRRRHDVDELAQALNRDGQFPAEPPPRGEITSWSRKSRANMFRAFGELDYEPMYRPGTPPAMITLTYSGDWQIVAPNGKAVTRHLAMFRRAFERAWGRLLCAIWKKEFQRRGAPHVHMMIVPPRGRARAGAFAGLTFRLWLSETWARIVAHPDPDERERHRRAGTRIDMAAGMKASDPRRVAVYFSKHGAFKAKEYQNVVPIEWQAPGAGPGRFWGYWRMGRYVYGVELDPRDALTAARTMRRWSRAQGVTRSADVVRTPGGRWRPDGWEVAGLAGALAIEQQRPSRIRSARRRVVRLGQGAGWVSVNDGASFASQLARYLGQLPPAPRLHRSIVPEPRPPPAPA